MNKKYNKKTGTKTHGMTGSPTYKTWQSMKSRCLAPNTSKFMLYGGRGITICERWLKFENFLQDMGIRPKGKTLDRIDSNGNYEKDNCRWSDYYEQNNNKSDNNIIEFNGQCCTLSGWARKLNMKRSTLFNRINRGWSIENALTNPVNHKNKNK